MLHLPKTSSNNAQNPNNKVKCKNAARLIQQRYADLPVIQTSMGWGKHAQRLGELGRYADRANMHAYTASHHVHGEALDDWHFPWARLITPEKSKAIWCTETGKSANRVDETTQAKYISRKMAEHFRRKVEKTFLYELIDVTDQGTHHGAFGLLRKDNTPRPSFTIVKNTLNQLSDPGPKFDPQPLGITLKGEAEKVRHVLLQKRHGDYYLLLWQEVQSWDVNTKQAKHVDPITIEVLTDRPMSSWTLFDPMVSADAIARSDSEQPMIAVPDYVVILQLKS